MEKLEATHPEHYSDELLAHVWGEVTPLGGPRARKRLVFKDFLAR
jgi:hypothetical protein